MKKKEKYFWVIMFFFTAAFVLITQIIWYIVNEEIATYLAGMYATVMTVGLLVIGGFIALASIKEEKNKKDKIN